MGLRVVCQRYICRKRTFEGPNLKVGAALLKCAKGDAKCITLYTVYPVLCAGIVAVELIEAITEKACHFIVCVNPLSIKVSQIYWASYDHAVFPAVIIYGAYGSFAAGFMMKPSCQKHKATVEPIDVFAIANIFRVFGEYEHIVSVLPGLYAALDGGAESNVLVGGYKFCALIQQL